MTSRKYIIGIGAGFATGVLGLYETTQGLPFNWRYYNNVNLIERDDTRYQNVVVDAQNGQYFVIDRVQGRVTKNGSIGFINNQLLNN